MNRADLAQAVKHLGLSSNTLPLLTQSGLNFNDTFSFNTAMPAGGACIALNRVPSTRSSRVAQACMHGKSITAAPIFEKRLAKEMDVLWFIFGFVCMNPATSYSILLHQTCKRTSHPYQFASTDGGQNRLPATFIPAPSEHYRSPKQPTCHSSSASMMLPPALACI